MEYTTEQCVAFVKHIQKHLDNGDRGLACNKLTPGVVGCCICGKDITDIEDCLSGREEKDENIKRH